jgi:phosphoserine phosphatase
VIQRFRRDTGEPPLQVIWAVGDNLNDLEMLREADRAFVIEPKTATLARDADAKRLESFDELTREVDKLSASAAGGQPAATSPE